jgi:3-oxoacyl-[acyl-carrier protein] reductase
MCQESRNLGGRTDRFRENPSNCRLTTERRETLLAATMTKREGQVADIAGTIHFLASPAARHITGQVLHVNGGALTTR